MSRIQLNDFLLDLGFGLPYTLFLANLNWNERQVLILSVLILYLAVIVSQPSRTKPKNPDQLTRIPGVSDFTEKAMKNPIFRVKK